MTPIATLDRANGGSLTIGDVSYRLQWTKARPNIMIAVLLNGAVAGAGHVSNVPDIFEPDSPAWFGEMTLHNIAFALVGSATPDGLRLALERPRCPHGLDRGALPAAVRALLPPKRETADAE